MSDIIKWDQSCSVGINELDEAHKALFQIGNRMIKAAVEKRGEEDTREVIEQMIEYAEKHFRREEELLELAKFPERQQHHAVHQRMMNDIRLYKSKYLAGNLEGSEVANFLIDWIVNHIKQIDKKYTPYVRPIEAL
jgi:hemerythrin-like metal-binding protein